MIGWMQKHMVFTLLLVVWMLSIVTWVVWRVFGEAPPDVPSSTNAALGIVFGLPALAVGLWKWRGELITRKRDADET